MSGSPQPIAEDGRGVRSLLLIDLSLAQAEAKKRLANFISLAGIQLLMFQYSLGVHFIVLHSTGATSRCPQSPPSTMANFVRNDER